MVRGASSTPSTRIATRWPSWTSKSRLRVSTVWPLCEVAADERCQAVPRVQYTGTTPVFPFTPYCRRGDRRPQGDVELHDPGPDFQRVVDSRELLQQFRSRLSEAERWLADQRGLGRSWADIAAETGENADALRMRLSRATDRVARELEIDA